MTIKEIQTGYLNSLYFKEIYLYLAHKKLSSSEEGIRKVEALAEKYILLDSLLFKKKWQYKLYWKHVLIV